MEKTSLTDSVRNEKVLRRAEEDRNMLRTIKRRRLTGLVASCVETVI